jgi:uncharacterized protein (TIGR02266 family)
MQEGEKRRYKRLSANLITRIRRASFRDTTLLSIRSLQQEARIKNISLGGVFIETNLPFELGAYVELDFVIPGYPDEIHALGVVKWSNDGSKKGLPVGMGIEFLELTARTKSEISRYVDATLAEQYRKELTKSTIHQNLLRYHCKRSGELIDKDVLASFLRCDSQKLQEVLADFEKLNLLRVVKDKIRFLVPEDKILSEIIKQWYEKQK